LTNSRRVWRSASQTLAISMVFLIGAPSLADPPVGQAGAAPSDSNASVEPPSLPQDGLFSSVRQSLAESENEVVRGHFDLGSAPNVHRYFCLVNPKTGHREPNGVLGDTQPRADGMTGIKISAVSLYTCSKAEQRGLLVTTGYVLNGTAGRASAASPPAPAAAATAAAPVPTPAPTAAQPPTPPLANAPALMPAPQPAPAPAPRPAAVPIPGNMPADRIDVAGVKLGMSPDDVRSVLKSKKLLHFKEWTETLSYWDTAKGAAEPIAKFVSVIAAWTPPQSSAGDSFETDGESFEVMFTPVPGKERAMAIIHSQGYSLANAIHEAVLEDGLVKKYGGYVSAGDVPQAATWRFQSDGSVQVGDSCSRHATFGGLGGLNVANAPRDNLALKRTPEEFRSQIEQCGDAIVTEDHFTANGGALPADRLVTRFTVTAYSPAIGFEGAKTASDLVQAGRRTSADAPKRTDKNAPNL
jgi:hypothetical protein